MSIQLASTDVLQAVLAAAPATNQLPIHASYVDQGGVGNNLPSVTTGTTPVTFVASPASGVERLVSQISICNDDTAAATVTVTIVRSSVSTRLCKITLQPGYALYYDGGWKVLDPNGNFLCNVTSTSGTVTSNQGTAAAITAPWPVELSNGTIAVGTSSAPLRIDPTGTTTQPVSLASLPALAAGSNVIGSVNQGTSPWVVSLTSTTVTGTVAVTQSTTPWSVQGDAASGSANAGNPVKVGAVFNTTQPTVTNGEVVDAQSTARGACIVATGVDTFNVTVNTALPAGSNAIGSVSVSNFPVTQAVSGTFWQSTQPVSLASLPALAAGSNTIGAVTQASSPWAFNLTQVVGTAIATPTAYGTAPSSGNAIPVNSYVTNNPLIKQVAFSITSSKALTTSNTTFGPSGGTYYLRYIKIDLWGLTSSAGVGITIMDGAGNQLFYTFIPATTTFTAPNFVFSELLNVLMNNSSAPLYAMLTTAISSGSIYLQIGYSNN